MDQTHWVFTDVAGAHYLAIQPGGQLVFVREPLWAFKVVGHAKARAFVGLMRAQDCHVVEAPAEGAKELTGC